MRSAMMMALLAVLGGAATGRAAGDDAAALTREVLARADAPYAWIAAEGVRGAYYSGLSGPEFYKPAAGAGLNCVLNKRGFSPDAPDDGLGFHAAEARACAEHGIKYFAFINFNSPTERGYIGRRYTAMIDAEGRVYPNTPSPLDREFWNQSIRRRWVQLAELAREQPLAGSAIDFEMYESEIVFYDRVGCLDYSDLAFHGFWADRQAPAPPVAPGDRARWLKEQGLAGAYEAYYRRELESICRDIEQAVHQANPALVIGFYSWDYHSPFYESCARGFGTPQMPALLWPGTTYSSGYSTREVDDQVRRLRDLGAHAVFIPGLWLWQFDPENLAAHAYLSARAAGGYWLYGIYSMWAETARKRKVPHVDAPAFWAALKRANNEIAAVRRDPSHSSRLKVDPSRSLFLAAEAAGVAGPAQLRPLDSAAPSPAQLDRQGPAAPLRYSGVYRAYGTAGQTLSFRVHSLRLGTSTHGTVASLLGPDHRLLSEQRVPAGKTQDLSVRCPATGTYTVVTQSGNVCSTVVSDAPYFVIECRPQAQLMTRVEPLYFYVPEGVKEFTFTGAGQGVERFNVRIVAPDGRILAAEENIGARAALKIAVPQGQDGQAWLLDLKRPTQGVLEDVTVGFSNNIPPYLARAKERLLVPKP